MKPLSCVAARRRLSAFHDGELPVSDRVAVKAHLRQCGPCTAEVSSMRQIGEELRARAAAAADWQGPAMAGIDAAVLNRLTAERERSVTAQVSGAFQDMRLGLAALGSAAATIISVLIVIGIFYFGPRSERIDSLAGMMEALGAPAVGMDSRVFSPPSAESGMTDSLESEEDAVFALAAVVTRNGRVASLEYLSDQSSDSDRARAIRLLDEVSRARFAPARMGGMPVAVRTVLVLTRTTVRGKMPVTPKQSSGPRGSESVRG
jgi:hypothetical protein